MKESSLGSADGNANGGDGNGGDGNDDGSVDNDEAVRWCGSIVRFKTRNDRAGVSAQAPYAERSMWETRWQSCLMIATISLGSSMLSRVSVSFGMKQ